MKDCCGEVYVVEKVPRRSVIEKCCRDVLWGSVLEKCRGEVAEHRLSTAIAGFRVQSANRYTTGPTGRNWCRSPILLLQQGRIPQKTAALLRKKIKELRCGHEKNRCSFSS